VILIWIQTIAIIYLLCFEKFYTILSVHLSRIVSYPFQHKHIIVFYTHNVSVHHITILLAVQKKKKKEKKSYKKNKKKKNWK